MAPSPLSARRIALLAAVVVPLVVVPSKTTFAAPSAHRSASSLAVSFVDRTGAPGQLLGLPRNKLVLSRTADGRLALQGKSLRLGRVGVPVGLSVRVDPAARRLTVRAGRRSVTLRRKLVAEPCALPGAKHIALAARLRCRPARPTEPPKADVVATPAASPVVTQPAAALNPSRDSSAGSGSAGVAATTTTSSTTATTTASVAPRLFSPTSVWNAPLPTTAALDPSGSLVVGKLQAVVAKNILDGTGPWIDTTSYSTPLYVVGPTQPTVRVTLSAGSWKLLLQQALDAVPIPDNAVSAGGADAHLTVWQPSTDRLWELWHAHKLIDGWHADFGGAIQGVSNDPGYYTTASWGALSKPWWGATASSLPVVAGTMLLSELRSGVIPHALSLNVPYARKGAYSWPAQRTDGSSTDPLDVPEGAHFRINPAVDVNALNLPPMARMMALAAQKYGMIVRDQTGWAVGFHAEDPRQFGGTDPYWGTGGFFGGKYPRELLAKFPWAQLQLVKMDLHGG